MAKQTFTLYTEDANIGGYDPSKFYRAEYSFIHWDDEEHPDFIVTLRFLEKEIDKECMEQGNTQNTRNKTKDTARDLWNSLARKGWERGCH